MQEKLLAEEKIRAFEKKIQNISVYPNAFLWINLLQCLQGFYFENEYMLVIAMCDVLEQRLSG